MSSCYVCNTKVQCLAVLRTSLRATEPVGTVNGQTDGEQGYTYIMVTLAAGTLQGGGRNIGTQQEP